MVGVIKKEPVPAMLMVKSNLTQGAHSGYSLGTKPKQQCAPCIEMTVA